MQQIFRSHDHSKARKLLPEASKFVGLVIFCLSSGLVICISGLIGHTVLLWVGVSVVVEFHDEDERIIC